MTTRGFAQAFLVAGTNRAAVRFAALNMLCMDMEDFRDVSAWPDRIRQDVSRSPGGDSNLFLNDCIGCHAGLDGLAGAFAYYDYDATANKLNYTLNSVQPKFLKAPDTFPFGYKTTGDSWINYWRVGPNAFVGWQGPGSGNGAKSLGMELAQDAPILRVPGQEGVREGLLPHAERQRGSAGRADDRERLRGQQPQHEARVRRHRRVLHGRVTTRATRMGESP